MTGGVGSGPDNVEHTVEGGLEFDAPHTWRARAVIPGGAVGPWSTAASFRTPSGGYIRDNEVFDPLTNGRTVGEIVGPVTFIPGVGVRLDTFFSHIRYRLPRPLVNGEFSMVITNVATNTEGGKTKLFAMSEGLSDLITNNRRFTVEKRGDPEGIVAWRMITHNDQIDTEGAERAFVSFNPEPALPLDRHLERQPDRPRPGGWPRRPHGLPEDEGLSGRLRSRSALRLHRCTGRPQRT